MNDAPTQGQDSPLGNTVAGTNPQTSGTDQPTEQPIDQQQLPQQPVGSPLGQKEQEPATQAEHLTSTEEIQIEEVGEQEAVPEEVQGWVERVERGEDIHLARPVVHQGQTLVAPVGGQSAKIVLPLTDEATKLGLHRKVIESVRWLAEWCWRLVKKLPGRVMYEEQKGIS